MKICSKSSLSKKNDEVRTEELKDAKISSEKAHIGSELKRKNSKITCENSKKNVTKKSK